MTFHVVELNVADDQIRVGGTYGGDAFLASVTECDVIGVFQLIDEKIADIFLTFYQDDALSLQFLLFAKGGSGVGMLLFLLKEFQQVEVVFFLFRQLFLAQVLRTEGQRDLKFTARTIGIVMYFDGSVMQFYELMYQVHTNTCRDVSLFHRQLGIIVVVEDVGQPFGRNADAVVAHHEISILLVLFDVDVNDAAHCQILEGIGQQVYQYFVEIHTVYPYRQLLHVVIEVQENHLCLDGRSKHLNDILGVADEVGLFHVQV